MLKIQCLKCKEIVGIGAFRSSEVGLHIRCESCREEYFVEAPLLTARPRSRKSDRVQDIECPKCDARVPGDAVSCQSCGLQARRFLTFRDTAHDRVPQHVLAAWVDLQEAWWCDDLHERFLALASTTDSYAYAAKVYRRVLRDKPDDPIAKQHLDRLTKMSAARAFVGAATLKTKESSPYKALLTVFVLLILVGGIAGFYVLDKHARTPPAPSAIDDVASYPSSHEQW